MNDYVVTEDQLRRLGAAVSGMTCRVGEALPLVDLIREISKQSLATYLKQAKEEPATNQ